MEVDVANSFNVENPLHVDNIPVASLVILEVQGEPVLEPKSTQFRDACLKLWDRLIICGCLLMLFLVFGGFLSFIIWMVNPFIFGNYIDD